MRIQHNIMAMNAYRNYTNNVAAMKANLEKLSSGYKINRAGDDAAGLAISEKMRAQITGLQTAQKNAKDGISLVQTAEGALTEVHDMLNRMVELASMSANGTYDNTTDRAQLQKEMDQLTAEINRIADSSNFNGIKLLDGSMSTSATKIAGSARIIDSVYTSGTASELSGTKTFLDGEVPTESTPTEFTVDFSGLTAKLGESTGGSYTDAENDVTATPATTNKTINFTSTNKLSEAAINNIKGTTVTVGDCTVSFADLDLTTDDTFVTAGNKAKAAIEAQTAAWNTTEAAKNKTYDKLKDVTVTLGDTGASVAYKTNTQTFTPDADVDFTFKIGGTEFTGAQAADGDDEIAIAAAVEEALDAAATKAGTDTASAAGGPTVAINGINYSYTNNGDGTITFKLEDTPTEKNIAANYDWDVKGKGEDTFDGNHTAGVIVNTPGTAYKDAPVANTVFRIEEGDIKDGTKITIDGVSVTLAVGKNSKVDTTGSGVIDLTHMEENAVDLDQAISAISKGFEDGTTNFIVGVNNTANDDTHKGLTVHKNGTSKETYDTKAKLADVFSIEKAAGGGLTLQIGDTADSYNQLKVSIADCHAAALGLSGISIADQDSAAAAVDAIKAAINKVSDVRGTLGATQNRLDHTINNLSVMTENIQDAESTIRDVDVAEEMMAYTKNNILIQSAQAMLAQANQVPQGVLQLLQ